jgi:hypothetical protein
VSLLAEPDLGEEGRMMVASQVATLARIVGLAEELRAERRAQLLAEQADPKRRAYYLPALGDCHVGVVANIAHPGTPQQFHRPGRPL